MTNNNEKNHTPAAITILVGMLLLVLTMAGALAIGSWHHAGVGVICFVAWVIGCAIVDVIVNRNR